ncbi:MAG: energy-coupling factor ABC transporter ATP-binding protein [Lactobacillaceae bacterium]|jgi:energy-coupling factor transport system ATP-binding protein|nr:energy-coupling factor ABC transporter ATP-binding protein [Lactobacillaceae bacterium]
MSIIFNDVSFKYESYVTLQNISTTIPENKTTVIIGKTGSGKSTFINLVDGLLLPDSGNIVVDDSEVTRKTKEKALANIRRKIGFVFQQPHKQLFANSVLEDVSFALKNFSMDLSLAKKTLDRIDFPNDLRENSVFDLSLGQQRMVAVAGVMAYQPKYLIFDEPTSGLDQENKEIVFKQITTAPQTKIIVTHDLDTFLPIADNILVFNQGQIYKQGTYDQIYGQHDELISRPTFQRVADVLGLGVVHSVEELGGRIK